MIPKERARVEARLRERYKFLQELEELLAQTSHLLKKEAAQGLLSVTPPPAKAE
jgi:hypothetical protein